MKYLLFLFVTIAVAGCVSTPDTGHEIKIAESSHTNPPLNLNQPTTESTEARRYPESDHGLDDYIAIALENNSGLRASFENWVAAMERVPQATALPEPRLEWKEERLSGSR